MSASPAYSYYPESSYEPSYAPSISVVPGRKAASEPTLNPSILFLAKTVAIVLLFIAAFCFIRITLSSMSVSAAIESKQLNSLIQNARAEGAKLEVRQSALASPERIRIQASSMNLSAPEQVLVIDLSGDVVVTDNNGNLALSQSLLAAADAAGAGADDASGSSGEGQSSSGQDARGSGMAEGA